VTGYSSARTPILREMYIYNYILSVIVVKVPSDRETSPRTQTAVSALVGDRLTASIQVVTKRQSPLSRPSASFKQRQEDNRYYIPAFQDDLLSASPLELRPQIRVNVVELIYDRLVYISVCLRTRQDTISYSSDIYSSKIGTSKDVYGKKTKDEYGSVSRSGLLLVFSLSVRLPRPPPGQLSILLSRRSFILSVDSVQPISGRVCPRGTWPTNQRSPLA